MSAEEQRATIGGRLTAFARQSADDANEYLATLLEALSDATRLRIVEMTLAQGEVACSELDDMLGVAKSTISYHVKILSAAGLIHTERQGRFFRYSPTNLAAEVVSSLKALASRNAPLSNRE